MSVVSFLLLISGLRKSKKMVKYNTHEGLNERMPNYQVRLGLGLHLGYAIEGAIGSYYKIDASYLSPNVRMAERLEGATKHFGVPLLISGSLFDCFTDETKDKCRQVDNCVMAGNPQPVRLYTVDVDPEMIGTQEEESNMTLKQKKIERVHQRFERNKLRDAAFDSKINVSSFFESNQEIADMRSGFTEEYHTTYKSAFSAYQDGDWKTAADQFNLVLELKPEDKPTMLLLQFMNKTKNVAPSDWQGF